MLARFGCALAASWWSAAAPAADGEPELAPLRGGELRW